MRPRRRPVPAVPALAACLLAFSGTGARALHGQEGPLGDFDAYVREAVQEWGAVGLAVAVVKDGRMVFAEGYGAREVGRPGAVDAATLFAIGSTTKAMTAAALGILVDEGRLAWDDPVTRHLPGFRLSDPWLTRELTVRDLLTHRAGLGNADYLWYGVETDVDEVLDRFSHAPVAYSPRTSFIYQNVMYAAAGAVVEAVSGRPWEDFLEERIFRPLGMDRTVALLSETEGVENVAAPHGEVDGEVVPIGNASVDPVKAAGSVWSSVEEMSRWLGMLLAGGVAPDGTRILSDAVVEEMFSPQSFVTREQFYPTSRLTQPSWTTYGLGWFQQDYRGRKVDYHTGSIDGMVAMAGLVRDEGLGVYVLANRDHVEVRHALLWRVLDLYLAPEEARDWSGEVKALYDGLAGMQAEARERAEAARVSGTTPSHPLGAYVGTYGSDLYGTVTVSERDGGLWLERGPGLRGALEHWHYDTFVTRWEAAWRGPWTVTFRTGASGSVSALEVGGTVLPRTSSGGDFWSALQALCGQAFAGTVTESEPPDPAFETARLVMHVRECTDDEIRIPFHVGDDRSRTWVITRSGDGLRLKHDHRHQDGTEDEVTWYGGDSRSPLTALRQEFPADAHTATLLPAAATNVWTLALEPGRSFSYRLRREGSDRRFSATFDLSRPLSEPPPPPWGSGS
ncbi:MAG TPA: serine hydrolase [Longimicrobiales bacterium]|nr:serine hydrolase [Longimicrobiales bacterium]